MKGLLIRAPPSILRSPLSRGRWGREEGAIGKAKFARGHVRAFYIEEEGWIRFDSKIIQFIRFHRNFDRVFEIEEMFRRNYLDYRDKLL